MTDTKSGTGSILDGPEIFWHANNKETIKDTLKEL